MTTQRLQTTINIGALLGRDVKDNFGAVNTQTRNLRRELGQVNRRVAGMERAFDQAVAEGRETSRITAHLEDLRREASRVEGELSDVESQLVDVGRTGTRAFDDISGRARTAGLALVGAGTGIAFGVASIVNSTLEDIRELREEATRQNVGLRDAAISQQVARNLGLEGDAGRAVEIFGELERRIGEVGEADLFERLGLDQRGLAALDDFERIDQVVRRILDAPVGERASVTDQLLGGEGGEALNQLLTGVTTIEQWNAAVDAARQNPRVVNIDDLEHAALRSAELNREFMDLRTTVATAALPALETVVDIAGPVSQGMRRIINENPGLVRGFGLTTAGAVAFGGALLVLGTVGPPVATATRLLGINSLFAAGGTKVAASATWAWNAALAANPVGLVAIGVGTLVAAIAGLAFLQSRNRRETSELTSAYDTLKVSIDELGRATLEYRDAQGEVVETQETAGQLAIRLIEDQIAAQRELTKELLIEEQIRAGLTRAQAETAVQAVTETEEERAAREASQREIALVGRTFAGDAAQLGREALELRELRAATRDLVQTLGGPIDRTTGRPFELQLTNNFYGPADENTVTTATRRTVEEAVNEVLD